MIMTDLDERRAWALAQRKPCKNRLCEALTAPMTLTKYHGYCSPGCRKVAFDVMFDELEEGNTP